MIRIYSKLAIPLLTIFIALSIAARALGSTQPPNPALRGFTEGCDGKPQPCWYGIGIARTNLSDAQKIMDKLGYIPINPPILSNDIVGYERDKCDQVIFLVIKGSNTDDRFIYGQTITFCTTPKIGDLILALGQPQTSNVYAYPNNPLQLAVFYDSHQFDITTTITNVQRIPAFTGTFLSSISAITIS